jgi:hypothetical protein
MVSSVDDTSTAYGRRVLEDDLTTPFSLWYKQDLLSATVLVLALQRRFPPPALTRIYCEDV